MYEADAVPGAIVPVMPGRMRNIWYPSKRAEYMTSAQLETMPDVVIERDFTFGMDKQVEIKATKKVKSAPVQSKLLTVRPSPPPPKS